MEITDNNIDGGKPFDWGRTSSDYAKFRDIYPPVFYEKILERGLCIKGQKALDIGTGTGVIPRSMYKYGADWTAADISENQIKQAKLLSEGMNINYITSPAEEMNFKDNSFHVITACQCFFYFNHEKIMPKLYRMLKPGGSILILYMAWLPFEDKIASESEKTVLKYNPQWSGAGETMHAIYIPDCYNEKFSLVYREEYRINIPFTRESWNGRIKSCRGIGASLDEKEIETWEKEHKEMLEKISPPEFEVLHYGAVAELKKL